MATPRHFVTDRRKGESLRLTVAGVEVRVTIKGFKSKRAVLLVEAPDCVTIQRGECAPLACDNVAHST